jgi:mannitol-1-phosphate/altronate dehydrogenase
MTFRIAYFRNGEEVGRFPCPKLQHEVSAIAKAGLKRFNAHTANVLDETGKVIEVVKVDDA